MIPTLPGVEKRLQDRYQRLVQEHAGHAHAAAAGPRILPDEHSPQAAAMAAWRFYHNPRTTFNRLAQPLIQAGCEAATRHCRDYALVALDWSWLSYGHHTAKVDRLVGPYGVVGYPLLSALLLSDREGQPLAPLCMQLETARGLLSSRLGRLRPARTALDELAPVMGFVHGLPFGKRPVFIIDAEGDSVYHFRLWQRRGWLFLARGDDDRKVRLGGPGGAEMLLSAVARRLHRQRAFRRVGRVRYEGRKVGQYVAEVGVVLDRPAWLNREVDGHRKRRVIPGVALPLRLIITELRDPQGKVLERWYLLTNVPAAVTAATIAQWYYWRWKVETFYKLLKSAGQQVEHWQQEEAAAILKRLLLASMACVLAWGLGHSQAPGAAEARRVVMRLSGRQVAYGQEYTQEGLLAGVWVLLAVRAVQQRLPDCRLEELADWVLHGCQEPYPAAPFPLRKAS